jgi:hypothetical protein
MQTRHLILVGIAALCAAAVVAQTLRPDLPHKSGEGYMGRSHSDPAKRVFQFQGKAYLSLLEQPRAKADRDWQPSAPLPISLAKAEEIGRAELRKFVKEDAHWPVAEISISRFRGSIDWYYAVTFSPEVYLESEPRDSFVVLVDFSGKPGLIAQTPIPMAQH